MPDIVTYINNGVQGYNWTGTNGNLIYEVPPEYPFDIVIAHDTLKNVIVANDTTIYYTLSDPHYTKVYFNFYCGGEKFDPVSVSNIYICRNTYYLYNRYTYLFGDQGGDSLYHYDDVYAKSILGTYGYEFYINEKNYRESIKGEFTVSEKDTVVYVDIHLKPSYRVTVHVLDMDHNVMPNLYVLMNDNGRTSFMATNAEGVADSLFFAGHYVVSVSDQMQEIDLERDTVLYFDLKDVVQNVKVKFLHDGKIVYPQISNLDFYEKGTNALYARLIADYYEDLDGTGEAWVFNDSVPCEPNSYYFNYQMNDYDYTDADFRFDFQVNGPGSSDTTMYVVIPVKRTVSITIKDALGALVKGVNADIYKYKEDGTLNEDLYYDYNSHASLKTNTDGVVFDHLLPGRYQIRILDIVRDFVVTDYDLWFEIQSGLELVDVTYYVLYENSKEPVVGVSLEIKKEGEFYTLRQTDEEGAVYTQCEPGDYTYYLNYAQISGSVVVDRKRTVFIYVPDPIKIKSMNIATCQIVNFNDTISLPLTITPNDATMQDVEWSVDNEVLARVFSDGKLIVNNIGVSGYFTVTAKSTDGSGKEASIKMYVGQPMVAELPLLIDGDKTDVILDSDSINLTVSKVDQFNRYYIYQSSTDSISWTNAYGPTQESSISLPASVYANETTYFRVVSATSSADVMALASNRKVSCATAMVSNKVVNRTYSLTPLNWQANVCSANTIVLAIDSSNISALPEGFAVNWYLKKAGEAEFAKLNATNKDSIVLNEDSVVTVKVALERDSVELKKYEKTINIVRPLRFSITTDDSIYCEGADAVLTLNIEEGEPTSILWSNGSTEKSITVEANDKPYSVKVGTRNAVCPTLSDSVVFVLDRLPALALQADKSFVCQTGTDTVFLSVVNPLAYDSAFVWSVSDSQDSILSVVPMQTTTYSVTANSKYGKCGSATASVAIGVDAPIIFSIVADDSIYCKGSKATLTLNVEAGEPTSILWSNGATEQTIEVEAEDIQYSVKVGTQSAICPMLADSIQFKLDYFAPVQFTATKSVICGAEVDSVVLTLLNPADYDSLFIWNGVASQDSFMVVSPTETTTYSLEVNSKLGRCAGETILDTIFVDVPVRFTIEPSDTIACTGSDVTLTAKIAEGGAVSYLWNNGSTDSVITVSADTVVYGVVVAPLNGGCPAVADSVRLQIEYPVNVELSANENLICYTQTDSVQLTVTNNTGLEVSAYYWSDSLLSSTQANVLPKVSTTYTVYAVSKNGKCKGEEVSVTVNVVEPIDASIKADVSSLCQSGTDKVILTAQSKAGVESPTFIWWDGVSGKDSIRVVAPDTTTSYWVSTKNSACLQAGSDSVTVVVAKPSSVSLVTASDVFEYGGAIDFTAQTTSSVVGPYTWISVAADGEETVIEVTDTAVFREMPTGDATYYVKIENGACPELVSGVITTHLVDNIVIPTVFTPHEKNGENDDFMPGYEVIIYDRYGNIISDSKNGWDGDYKGDVADAGVYIYVLTLKDGRVKKGTIEVYRRK